MVQIICLVCGIIYALRLPKLNALTADQFPQVPPDQFLEWKTAERSSIILFLWASWGLLLIGTPILYIMAQGNPGGSFMYQILYFLVFIVLLGVSAVPGSKASRIKKEH